MSDLIIVTNSIPRLIVSGYQLTDNQKEDFDYIEDIDSHDFVLYKNCVYDIGEFVRIDSKSENFNGWHAASANSWFTGVLIKLCDDNDYVIMGRYYQ